jgi:hypothetical protein
MHTRQSNRKNKKISLWCTPTEKKYIEIRARKAGFSTSEYIRELGLKDYLKRPKTLPPEVLAFNGQISQLSASLYLIARRRLNGEDLNALERAELQHLGKELTQLLHLIKTYLQ